MATDKSTTLLTLEERAICERVGISSEAPHSQRAQALLALDDGLSQAEASKRAGLTAGQVKYWLGRFRQQRTGIFPDELQAQPASAKTPEKEPEPEKIEERAKESQPAKVGEKKTKKAKKVKGKKKKSKDVKEKPSKKKKKKGSKKKGAKKTKGEKKKDRKKKKSKKAKKGKE